MNKLGKRLVLSVFEEDILIDILQLCAKWSYDMKTKDIRIIVRGYLNSTGRKFQEFKGELYQNV